MNMIAAKRTSRDSAAIILPVIILFCGVFTYVSLAANGLVGVVGDMSLDASWIAPPISIVLWIVLVKYIYRLINPVTYLTEVFPDQIVFSDSSKPSDPTILRRADVVRFYIQPRRWWHNPDGFYPVLCDTRTGETIEIGWDFVYDRTASPFFEAVRSTWGEQYTQVSDINAKMDKQIE